MQIIDYLPEYAIYFEKFNKAWLEEHFVVEPIDEWVLTNPEKAIINQGGKIYFVESEGKIIGTVALKWVEPTVLEMTKMAVDKEFRGAGAGKMLCETAVEKAKELGAEKLILYSQTSLAPAIAIYRKFGFLEVPLEKGKYARADIKMELALKTI